MVDVITDFTITGRLARFGRGGMIEDISKRMMRDFSQCLQATITSEPAAAEAPAAAAEAPAATAPVTPGEEADAAVASAGGAAAEASAASSAPAAQEPPAPPRPQPQAAKPVHGIRLVLSVLWERVRRFFARLVGRGEK